MSSRTIFITGCGAGIGAATARLFARNGWIVGGCDIDAAGLQALQSELGSDRLTSCYVADVRHRSSIAHAVSTFARANGGHLDAVFANAGVLFMGPDETITPEQKELLIDVNVKGVVNTFDAALPFLRKSAPGSHAVAMCSTSAEYGSPQHAVYGATKFFVRGYTEALNIEYRRQGINVCGVYVSYVDTRMVTGANFRPASVDKAGAHASAEDVAGRVWQAVHGDRSHWRVGFVARGTHYAVRLLGPWVAPIYSRLMGV